MKKTARKRKTAKRPKIIGKVTHYFGKIKVGIIKLSEPMKVGDFITIKNKKREFTQQVKSIQLNHENINTARHNAEIGIKVIQKVHEGDVVFKAKPLPAVVAPMLPIFLNVDKPAPRPLTQQKPPVPASPLPPAPPASTPQTKKGNYSEVKFLKF